MTTTEIPVTDIHCADDLLACIARPAGPGPHPGVIVLMEAFGLTAHIRGVCARLAAEGYVALAPDHYHGETFGYGDMENVLSRLQLLDDDLVMQEMGAALETLSAQADVDGARLGVVGFCMGGRLAFLAGCRHPQLRAVASFYGGGIAPGQTPDRFGRRPPIGEADALQAPLLLVYGADDSSIPPAEHARVTERLSSLHKRYTLSVYPGAGHGFCCEDRPSYAPAAVESAFAELGAFFKQAFAL